MMMVNGSVCYGTMTTYCVDGVSVCVCVSVSVCACVQQGFVGRYLEIDYCFNYVYRLVWSNSHSKSHREAATFHCNTMK
jgi:hypothetical protein